MTPEQIEVGGYYRSEYSESEIHVSKIGNRRVSGMIASEKACAIHKHSLYLMSLVPSTREAFNAAVDRVVSKVKGEA